MSLKRAAAVSALLLAGLAAFLVISAPPGLAGVQIKDPDTYTLDVQRMSGTDRHTLALSPGDVLQVEFQTERGALHLEIAAPDGTLLYAGNGKAVPAFQLSIRQSGPHTITVKARRAAGMIHIHANRPAK